MSRLEELKNISEDGLNIYLGSMVTFTDIKESSIIFNNFNALIECAENMGSPQIRNVATIGGNIANAGSAADIVPCIISLEGILVIETLGSPRRISCESYFKNYTVEKIKNNEILTKIIIPKKNEKSGYYKLGKRNALAIARVSASISIKVEDNIVKNIIVCLGAVGRFPFRAYELEKHAVNKKIDWLFSEEPLNFLDDIVKESIKGRKTMPFKKEAIKGVYKEALRIAIESNVGVNK
jgi:CO/xanthine dehydrogenase FAD-binding subunit